GRILGGRLGAAICVPTSRTMPASRARGHLARPLDGARAPIGAAQNGDAAPLQGPGLYAADRRRRLRRRIARRARACAQASVPCPLVERLRLLLAALCRLWLEQPALAPNAVPADADPGRHRRSDRSDRQRSDPGDTYP